MTSPSALSGPSVASDPFEELSVSPTAFAVPGLFDTVVPTPRADDAPGSGRAGPGRLAGSPSPPPSRSVVQLLGAARDELRAAQEADDPAERFRSAHLGALRAAAAVLALRARARRSSRPTDAWSLLTSVAPEYGEWAAFFAAHSTTRSVIEAGVRGRVSLREADDMVRQADLFLALVTRTVAGRAGQ